MKTKMKKYRMTFTTGDMRTIAQIFCDQHKECSDCPISLANNGVAVDCEDFAEKNPTIAAKLMGLKIVEIEDDSPKLTAMELAFCRAVGAKWVSRDKEYDMFVRLWCEKPECINNSHYISDSDMSLVGKLVCNAFPSVKPGDCIKVEE